MKTTTAAAPSAAAPTALDFDLGRHLVAAVPDAVRRMRRWSTKRRTDEAERCADVIASGGDALWADASAPAAIRTRALDVRDALVTGLAILAHRPGGVQLAGMEWDAEHPGVGASLLPDTWSIACDPAAAHRGAVFTPRELAEDVVANALGVVVQDRRDTGSLDIESLHVADIACGTGAFLVAATRYLTDAVLTDWKDDPEARTAALTRFSTNDRRAAARALVLAHCIHGVDVHALSVQIAGIALQLLAPTIQLPGSRVPGLAVGDALVGTGHPRELPPRNLPPTTSALHWPQAFPEVFHDTTDVSSGFDAIIGNPPFLGGNHVRSALGDAYREYLIDTIAWGRRGAADLAVYFLLRAHELVHANGVVAMIGPAGLFRATNAAVGVTELADRGWHMYRASTGMKWPTSSAATSYSVVWTHASVDPAEAFRNVPDTRPTGEYRGTVNANGTPVHRYLRPAPSARPRRRRRPSRPTTTAPTQASAAQPTGQAQTAMHISTEMLTGHLTQLADLWERVRAYQRAHREWSTTPDHLGSTWWRDQRWYLSTEYAVALIDDLLQARGFPPRAQLQARSGSHGVLAPAHEKGTTVAISDDTLTGELADLANAWERVRAHQREHGSSSTTVDGLGSDIWWRNQHGYFADRFGIPLIDALLEARGLPPRGASATTSAEGTA